MLENMNELEKIGLAFLSGLVAGQSLEISDEEVEKEESQKEENANVMVGKIEGEKAKEFIEFIEKLGGNNNGKCQK